MYPRGQIAKIHFNTVAAPPPHLELTLISQFVICKWHLEPILDAKNEKKIACSGPLQSHLYS